MIVKAEITEAKAMGLRKYFYEYVVIALTIAVMTLFGLYYNLNNFIIHTYNETLNHSSNVIDKNSEVLQTVKR